MSVVSIPNGDHSIELHHGDCLAGMEGIAAGSVDVVVTSPPYNLGVRYSSYDDTISRDEYLDWIERWAGLVLRTLSDAGSLFLNVGGKPSDPEVPFLVLQRMLDAGFRLQNTFHWIKSVAIDENKLPSSSPLSGGTVLGHYKPINSPRFVNDCHEYVFHLTKHCTVELDRLAVGVPYQDKSNVSRWKGAGNDLHCRGNVWYIPYRTISDRSLHRPHPATFPPELPEMCMRIHGLERIGRVLDPFLGIGNSAVACVGHAVDFIGYEIDRDYFDRAAETVRDEVAK